MTIDKDIALIKLQEEQLQFTTFTDAEAWSLGQAMRALAEQRKLPLVIDIRMGARQMFYTALPGTVADNGEWVRRKVNTVMRFGASSYRVALAMKREGKGFEAARGIDPMEYAAAGGGFPITIRNVGVVGCITVSGVPQRDDHGFVVEALCAHLGVAHKEIQLPPESH